MQEPLSWSELLSALDLPRPERRRSPRQSWVAGYFLGPGAKAFRLSWVLTTGDSRIQTWSSVCLWSGHLRLWISVSSTVQRGLLPCSWLPYNHGQWCGCFTIHKRAIRTVGSWGIWVAPRMWEGTREFVNSWDWVDMGEPQPLTVLFPIQYWDVLSWRACAGLWSSSRGLGVQGSNAPERTENMFAQRLVQSVHGHITCHGQRRLNGKQNMVYSYNGIVYSHKKEWSINTCFNIDEPWKQSMK